MPGSHRDWLGERLAVRDEPALTPIAPVDAALRDAGGRKTGSSCSAVGAFAMACAVFCCNVLMAISAGLEVVDLPLKVKDEIKRSVWFFDADRTREVVPVPTGGGGGNPVPEEIGLSVKKGCERGIGDRPF